jgi:hypothetical protein
MHHHHHHHRGRSNSHHHHHLRSVMLVWSHQTFTERCLAILLPITILFFGGSVRHSLPGRLVIRRNKIVVVVVVVGFAKLYQEDCLGLGQEEEVARPALE